MTRQRRPWRIRRFLIFTVGIVVCAALGMFFLHEGRAQSDQWASILGLFLNIAAILLTIDATLGVRNGVATRQQRPADQYLENLAAAAADGYAAEGAVRRLQDPDLLPVDWQLADRDLMDHPSNIWPDADVQPPSMRCTPSLSVLEAYLQVPTGRLVVLGDAGSGKTVAALTFAVESLAVRMPGEPVPVVLPASTWDPDSQDFRSWICGRLVELDPRLSELDDDGISWAHRLVHGRGVLPVLDGLDELPTRVKADVLRNLNAVLYRGEHIVITCRTEQYRAATEAGDVLTGAAVIGLQPLRLETLAAYLPRTTRPDGSLGSGTKWTPVLQQLSDHPDLPESRSIATVLSNPLMVWLARVQFSDTDADPAQLLRPEFRDPHALRQHLLDGLVAAAYADPGRHHPRRLSAPKAERWLVHLAAHLARSGGQNLSWWRFADGIPLRGVRVALTLAATVLSAVAATIVLSVDAGQGRGLFFGCLFGVVVGAAVWLIPWLRHLPQPTAVGPTTLAQGLRQVGRILVVVVIPIGGAVIVNIATVHLSAETLVSIFTAFGTVLLAFVVAPVEAEQAVDPQRLLKADRISAITQGCLIGFAAGLLVTTAAWSALPTAATLAMGAAASVASGLVWSIVGSAWGRFALMRLYWWGTGRLPLRLMTFLVDAHSRGVLRQVGATYQFRHELLQARLATRA
ncbi:NACHT domain-containing protein [Streptomyces sp. NPDC047081]|uniref:NACHT domain-containing protein n=1 Tax=Streptomyces sp. NPDC047081 TaxID=3154706 RepID=UPI0034110288